MSRNALKIRKKLSKWREIEGQVEMVSELSHGMTRGNVSEYFCLKGVKDLSILGKTLDHEAEIERRDSAASKLLSKLSTPERKKKELKKATSDKRSLSPTQKSQHLLIGASDWRSSNRFDPYFGEAVHPKEATIDSLVRVSRKEFGIVAKSSAERIGRGLCDPTDEHLFRASLGQLKSHPRMNDFLATVTLTVQENVIIGEPFVVNYRYVHKKEKDRLHCPGDWIGIFEVRRGRGSQGDEEGDGEAEAEAEAAVGEDQEGRKLGEKDFLICWYEIPELLNETCVAVDKLAIEEAEYYLAYFVNGARHPLAKSKSFFPKFVRSTIGVIGTAFEKDVKCFRRSKENSQVEIVCGIPFLVKFNIEHSPNFLHDHNDCVGLVKCNGDGVPEGFGKIWKGADVKKKAVSIARLPKDSNSGELLIQNGCSFPGYYRLFFFSYDQGNRVCGESVLISAVKDFGEMKKEEQNRRINRLFRIYISTRWDMDMERDIWRNVAFAAFRL